MGCWSRTGRRYVRISRGLVVVLGDGRDRVLGGKLAGSDTSRQGPGPDGEGRGRRMRGDGRYS